jgi:hypothetical protein
MHRRDWLVLIVLFNISLTFIGLQIIDEQVNNLENYVLYCGTFPSYHLYGWL